MNKNFKRLAPLTLALVAVATLALGGCASTSTPGEQINDAELVAKVKTKLAADPDINPFKIDVDASDGVVTLKGNVKEAGDKRVAERLARETSGVRRVVNRITVNAPETAPGSDAAITAAVKGKLTADEDINPFNIDVDTNEGVVTLSGAVAKESARTRAVELAKSVNGVKRVINDLKVKP